MKYLIFGGLGFVGNQLVRTLKNKKEEVVIADNYFRVAEKIEDISDVKCVKVDIRNENEVRNVILDIKPDIIINLAAIHYIPECNDTPSLAFDVNINGVLNILKTLEDHQPKSVVLISSGAVYADSDTLLEEGTSEVEPVDIYGITKKCNEETALVFSKNFPNIKFSIVRLFNVYGPRETNAHIIPEIISQLRVSKTLNLGNLKPRRDLIHVNDVANGLVAIANRNNGNNYETINLSSGIDISMEELIHEIAGILNFKINIQIDPKRFRSVDKMYQNGSTSKLLSLSGFKTEYDLSLGLRNLLEYEGFKISK